MKYLKFTKIDSETGISANIQTPRNGEVIPNVSGIEVIFQDANITEFWYATVNDDAVDNPSNQCWLITLQEFAIALSNTVEKLKSIKLKKLSQDDKILRDELLGVYHITALLAGTYKYDQAMMQVAGMGDPNDMLHLEASTRGIDPTDLANKIIEKYNKYVYIDALITGIRGKLEDRIESFSVDMNDPLASWIEFNSFEDIGNGTMLQKYESDIYGRMIPILNQGV